MRGLKLVVLSVFAWLLGLIIDVLPQKWVDQINELTNKIKSAVAMEYEELVNRLNTRTKKTDSQESSRNEAEVDVNEDDDSEGTSTET